MNMVRSLKPIAFAMLLALSGGNLFAQYSAEPTGLVSAERMSRSEGWAASQNGIYWTDNAGKTWKDVSPVSELRKLNARILSVFFLDHRNGWAVLCAADSLQPFLAYTNDTGVTWAVRKVSIPGVILDDDRLSASSSLSFENANRGWINLGETGLLHPAILAETNDGGITWTQRDSPVADGLIRFDPNGVGWLLATWDEALYTTGDRAATWKEVTVSAPDAKLQKARQAFRSLPISVDGQHALVQVGFSGNGEEEKYLFYSSDSGHTWASAHPASLAAGAAARVAPSASDAAFATVTPSSVIVTRLQSNGQVLTIAAPHSAQTAGLIVSTQSSFVEGTFGWVIAYWGNCGYDASCVRLISTDDGGNNWIDVSPFGPPAGVSPSTVGKRGTRTKN